MRIMVSTLMSWIGGSFDQIELRDHISAGEAIICSRELVFLTSGFEAVVIVRVCVWYGVAASCKVRLHG